MWLGASSVNSGEGIWIDQAFYFCLMVGSWIVVSSRRMKWGNFIAANTALILFYLYLGISIMWSDDPGGSFKRWSKVVGLVFVISVMLSEKDPLQAVRAVYVRCAIVLIPLSAVFIRYYPTLGQNYSVSGEKMFTGVTTQKNGLGEIAMVFGLFLVWDYLETHHAGVKKLWRRVPWDHLVLLLVSIWLLNVSQSKTALICMLVGLALMLRKGRLASATVSRVVLATALSLPFFLLVMQQFNSIAAPLVTMMGRDLTFTGRTDIWHNVLADKTVNPLIGAGFFNYWGGEGETIRTAMGAPGVHSAHNGFLDIYLDGGLIALGLLLCLLWTGGGRFIRNLRHNSRLRNALPQLTRYQLVSFAVLIVAISYNLSESNFARLTPTWFTTLLVLVNFPSLAGKYQKQREHVQAVGRGMKPPTGQSAAALNSGDAVGAIAGV